MKPAVFAIAAMVTFHACTPRGTAPSPPATADAAQVTAVCENYRRLGCAAGRPTPEGATCEVVTANAVRSGIVAWDLRCRAAATSCSMAEQCENGR
jgi:hypothetical protein